MNINVKWVLRADAIFNGLAGVALLFFIRPVLSLIGWPDAQFPIYANTLGAALVGLSLAAYLAGNHPEQSRDTILSVIIAKLISGVIILYYMLIVGAETSAPWFQYLAVGIQLVFVAGEALYLLSPSRPASQEQRLPQAS